MATVDTKLRILGDSAGAKKALAELETSLKKVTESSKKYEAVQKSLKTVAITSSAALGGMVLIMGKAVAEAGKQEDAEKRLQIALKNTGKYSQDTQARLVDYASQLQRTTRYGDEAVISAMAMVQTFADLDEKSLKELIPRIADLAKVLKTDLDSAAMLVAKTLSGNINLLGRQGIAVDMTGDKTQRLASLMESLTSKLNGQAKAARDTYLGAMDGMKNAIGEVWEEMGNLIIKSDNSVMSLNKLEDAFLNTAKYIKENQTALRNLGIASGSILTLVAGITTLGALIPPFIVGWKNLVLVLGAVRTAMLAMPYAAMAAGLAALTEGVLQYANAWVRANNEQAKAVNKELTTGKLWEDRASQLKKAKESSDKYYYGVNLAVGKSQKLLEQWGLTGEKYTIKTVEDLDKVIAMFEKTGQATKKATVTTVTAEIKIPETEELMKARRDYEIAMASDALKMKMAFIEKDLKQTIKGTEEWFKLQTEKAGLQKQIKEKETDIETKTLTKTMELIKSKQDYEIAIAKDVSRTKMAFIETDLAKTKEGTEKWYRLQAEKVDLQGQIKKEETTLLQEKADQIAAKRNYEIAIATDVFKVKMAFIEEDLAKTKEGMEEWYRLQTEKANLNKAIQDEILAKQTATISAMTNAYQQGAMAAIQANQSILTAVGQGLKAMIKQMIQEKIMEVMAEQLKVVAWGIMNAIPTMGASLSAIPPALAQAAAATAALKALEATFMAEGGIVKRPTLIMAGEAGPEAIVPLSRGGGYGGGSVSIVVNVSGVNDIPRITEALRRGGIPEMMLAKELGRRMASVGREA